jgi:hypothetical protein
MNGIRASESVPRAGSILFVMAGLDPATQRKWPPLRWLKRRVGAWIKSGHDDKG